MNDEAVVRAINPATAGRKRNVGSIPDTPATSPVPRLLTADEAAQLLRISPSEMRKLIATCQFPPDGVVRPTRGRARVLILESALVRFIRQRTEAPLSLASRDRRGA